MNLISDELRAQLLANGRQSLADEGFDPQPVVKLFTPDAGATWLLTEIDPDDDDHAFGLFLVARKPQSPLDLFTIFAFERRRSQFTCGFSVDQNFCARWI